MKILAIIVGIIIGASIAPTPDPIIKTVTETEIVTITETEYVTEYVCVMPVEEETIEYIPAKEDVEALAKTLWGECRGVHSKMEKAAVAWCVLNRLDTGYAKTVKGVVSAAGQFIGYSESNPVTDELSELAADVLTRHYMESQGVENVGRVLPKDYLWFSGRDGRNWFRNEYRTNEYWDWALPDPYEEEVLPE